MCLFGYMGKNEITWLQHVSYCIPEFFIDCKVSCIVFPISTRISIFIARSLHHEIGPIKRNGYRLPQLITQTRGATAFKNDSEVDVEEP